MSKYPQEDLNLHGYPKEIEDLWEQFLNTTDGDRGQALLRACEQLYAMDCRMRSLRNFAARALPEREACQIIGFLNRLEIK